MTVWVIAAGALMIGGLIPALLLAYRGPATQRLVGLELAGAVGTVQNHLTTPTSHTQPPRAVTR
jgi:hypothetical protein